MDQITKHTITIQNKKYDYTLRREGSGSIFVRCPAAHIAQNFLNEDIPQLLADLPNLILAEKKYAQEQIATIRFRVSPRDKQTIEKRALHKGYVSVSQYLRDVALAQ